VEQRCQAFWAVLLARYLFIHHADSNQFFKVFLFAGKLPRRPDRKDGYQHGPPPYSEGSQEVRKEQTPEALAGRHQP
jgi:hypothetical protein